MGRRGAYRDLTIQGAEHARHLGIGGRRRPYAYRGPHFAPDHGEEVLTDLEATLLKLIGSLSNYMCGGYEPRNEEEARISALLFSITKEHKV